MTIPGSQLLNFGALGDWRPWLRRGEVDQEATPKHCCEKSSSPSCLPFFDRRLRPGVYSPVRVAVPPGHSPLEAPAALRPIPHRPQTLWQKWTTL